MPIYDINDYRKKLNQEPKKNITIDTKAFYSRFEALKRQNDQPGVGTKLSTRLFFGFLLVLNTIWIAAAFLAFLVFQVLGLLTLYCPKGLMAFIQKINKNLKRSAVCWISLLIAIFNPALGIMFSCMYFMMYDRMGIEEIVPPSLREQFKEFFY